MDNLKPCPWCGGEVDYPAEMCGSHVKSMEIIGNIHDNPDWRRFIWICNTKHEMARGTTY